jgi:mannose-1-phosphate guanylyltransferase
MQNAHTWALVLAGGEGRRLQALTRSAHGVVVPKQFCSLFGGPSLLEDALLRAQAVVPLARVCTVVAEQHRQWWPHHVQSLPAQNVVVQPRSRGTANGILLPLLRIVQRDPRARVLILPSDHYVANELEFARWLRVAAEGSTDQSAEIVILGLEPRSADPELGYIVPRRVNGSRYWPVADFVEKPPYARARELLQRGAVWNTFIVAADARALLDLYERARPGLVARVLEAIEASEPMALERLYDNLADLDFSRDVLAPVLDPLRVLAVPEVGWSDLGTPQRLREVLLRGNPVPRMREQGRRGCLVLAQPHMLGLLQASPRSEALAS